MRLTIIRNIIIAITCLLSCLNTSGITRRGLVIGLGEYQDKAWSKIHGDRDVTIVKDMLVKCGYTDVVTLVNKQATKAGIISTFSQLTDRCRKGDIVYIHFSGHGQQITDVNGDEDDGWDEAWIPYDALYSYSNSYRGEKHLIDDEIAIWMSKIKNKIGIAGNLLLVVDACHSGDSSRDGIEDDVRYIRGADKDFIIPMKQKPTKIAKTKENWLTLTACRDFQVNCEVKTTSGEFYGMLSYAICKGHPDFKKKDNNGIAMQLQQFVDKFRHQLPQDITLTGLTSKQSLSTFFR